MDTRGVHRADGNGGGAATDADDEAASGATQLAGADEDGDSAGAEEVFSQFPVASEEVFSQSAAAGRARSIICTADGVSLCVTGVWTRTARGGCAT